MNNLEDAEEANMRKIDYTEDLESGDSSPCCSAEITDHQGFCSDCKEYIL